MASLGCSVSDIKERGAWASDVVHQYIKPTMDQKIKVDKVLVNDLS